jgi:hypothetical protein
LNARNSFVAFAMVFSLSESDTESASSSDFCVASFDSLADIDSSRFSRSFSFAVRLLMVS